MTPQFELSHRDGSNERSQDMLIQRNKKLILKYLSKQAISRTLYQFLQQAEQFLRIWKQTEFIASSDSKQIECHISALIHEPGYSVMSRDFPTLIFKLPYIKRAGT